VRDGLVGGVRRVISIAEFRGIDLSADAADIAPSRSPDAPNMTRGEPGKVCKRTGYEVTAVYPGRINGVHFYKGTRLVHAGTSLHWDSGGQQRVFGGLANARSVSRPLGGYLCIADGKALLVFDGENVTRARDAAYVPTLLVSRAPGGGGQVHEPLNLLTGAWSEQFLGNGNDTVYRLSFGGLSAAPVEAKIRNSSGGWGELTEGTHFSVNRSAGTVTFASPPSAPLVSGQDNVVITARRERPEETRKVDGCTVMELYGAGGSPDRLFVSGNPEYPELDFHSQLNNPLYFGETWYSNLGRDGSEVTGYSVLSDALATHKRSPDGGGTIVVRRGVLQDGEAVFPAVNTLRGEAAVAPHSFREPGESPFFLTRRGVFTVAARELTGEKYSRPAAERIAPALQGLPGLEDAFAFVHGDFYMLAIGEDIWLLEYQTGRAQCDCYRWTGLPARVLFEEGGRLCFGTPDGRLCAFFTDTEDPASYYDDGEPIEAYWETPDLHGKYPHARKTFRGITARLASAPFTGMEIFTLRGGRWEKVWETEEQARYLCWRHIDFGKFVFSSDTAPRLLTARVRERRTHKARFRLRNAQGGEPFGLQGLGFEYERMAVDS
jgi:hypothetical protein